MFKVDRTDLWVPLLQRLTARHPRWSIWKNAESAFAGSGDIDSFAPPGDWPAILETFREWAAEARLGPVIVCRHIPQGPHFIALQDDSEYIVQLDVKDRGTFRGSTLIDYQSLLPLSEIDDRGFRRIRPGVEGIIKLCMNGVRRGGRPNTAALVAKRVGELLASDAEGVRIGADLLGPARNALQDGVAAVIRGEWDRRAMATVEAYAFLRGIKEPHVAASRLKFLAVDAKRCPIIRLIRVGDRRVPADRAAWLREVSQRHEIHPTGYGPG